MNRVFTWCSIVGALIMVLWAAGANATIVPLTWDYASTVDSYAYAKAKNKTDDDTRTAQGANAQASAQAHAFASQAGQNEDAYLTTTCGGSTDSNGAKIHSRLQFSCVGNGTTDAFGEGTGAFDGVLSVGTSQWFPAGSDGPTLTVETLVTLPTTGWSTVGWTMSLYEYEGGPLLAAFDQSNDHGAVPVKAGQAVYVRFTHSGNSGHKTSNTSLETDLDVSFDIIPEPSAVAMLCLVGGLVARRRKK